MGYLGFSNLEKAFEMKKGMRVTTNLKKKITWMIVMKKCDL